MAQQQKDFNSQLKQIYDKIEGYQTRMAEQVTNLYLVSFNAKEEMKLI